MQSGEDRAPLLPRSVPVESFGADPCLAEHCGHPVRERHGRDEHDRLAPGCVLSVGSQHVEGRRGLLEHLPERVGVEVPAGLLDLIELDLLEPHPDAADVGQVAGADHLSDPALVDDLLPDVAELFAVGARRGGGHAEDQRRGGEVLQDPAVAPRAGVMRLVDDDCVELLGQSCEPVGARERLHAADDDGAADVVALSGDEPDP